MRCAACDEDQPPGCFSNSQRKKPAASRKCTACAACAAAATSASGGPVGDALVVPAPPTLCVPATPTPRVGGSSTTRADATAGGATGGTSRAAPTTDLNPEPVATPAETQPPPPKACAWAGCGRLLSGEAAAKNRCARCKRKYYCSRRCQKKDWKEGVHKLACTEPPCCTICLEGGEDPLPLQCGCACRGDAGLAHVACKAAVAAHRGDGWNKAWATCQTCGQSYTGGMQLGLARELVQQTERRTPGDDHRLIARRNLGQALFDAGVYAEAEVLLRDVLAVRRRVFGRSHRSTRTAATTVASVLVRQGQHAEAVALYRENLAATPDDDQEHENTLADKANLAAALSDMGEHAETEALLRGVLATEERLHGMGDARTLQTAPMLGRALQNQGKYAEAVAVYRSALAAQRRVLGPEHPQTLRTMHNLAFSLSSMGQYAEAEPLYRSVLEGHNRALGPEHVDTLNTARNLVNTLDALGKHAEAEALRQ